MRLIRFVAVLVAIGLIFVVGFGYGRWYSTRPAAQQQGRKALYYVDAMHPWYKSDKPGIAPDCGMKLTPVYSDGSQGASEERKVLRYRDPKDAGYTSATPGMNPATGNDLVPVYADEAAIKVNDERQQSMGVRYGQVEWTTDTHTIRATGRVMPDETLFTRVQARVEGWVQKVNADYTGKPVKQGDVLLTMYSPELLAAQQEYLLAARARDIMDHSSMTEIQEANHTLADAARHRLLLLNFNEDELTALDKSRLPSGNMSVYAPAGGYVMTRNAFPGQRVSADTELYTIANLSNVWVVADVFEADAGRVQPGQAARVTVTGEKADRFVRVTFLPPQVDPATRTMKVRLELKNEDLRLRPDMYVDVAMDIAGARRLTVPADAVIDTGTGKTVFLDRGNGYFEPHAVETGERLADRVEIVKGLNAGDRIAVSGAFLLNSEAQMKRAGQQ
jgi:RND family efflux transporter MFP subunit